MLEVLTLIPNTFVVASRWGTLLLKIYKPSLYTFSHTEMIKKIAFLWSSYAKIPCSGSLEHMGLKSTKRVGPHAQHLGNCVHYFSIMTVTKAKTMVQADVSIK